MTLDDSSDFFFIKRYYFHKSTDDHDFTLFELKSFIMLKERRTDAFKLFFYKICIYTYKGNYL